MALVADANGVLKGKFTIPAKVVAGTQLFEVVGAGGTTGSTNFVGQGTLVSEVLQSLTQVTTSLEADPLAQTFTLAAAAQLAAVDLFVTAKGTSPIIVQLRETSVGFPTSTILAEARLELADLVVSAWNRFTFDSPILVPANSERAIVVLCNDALAAVAIAELGKFDSTAQRWVTSQPYQVGVLLSSSNATTWTSHQDKDMSFRLQARTYTETSHEIPLGKVTVTDATDLIVLSMADNVATGADSDIVLTMPSGDTVTATDGQNVSLSSAITGDIIVTARVRSASGLSAVMHPGSQIASGTIQTSAEYITTAINADAAGCNLRVVYDAILPSGSSVSVMYMGTDSTDVWASVPSTGSPTALGDSLYEYQYYLANVTEAQIRIKLILNGTTAARPYVYNLRVTVTDIAGT